MKTMYVDILPEILYIINSLKDETLKQTQQIHLQSRFVWNIFMSFRQYDAQK